MFEANIHRNQVKNNAETRAAREPRFNGFENDFATNLAPSASMLGHYGGVQEILDRSRGGARLSQAEVKAPGADPGAGRRSWGPWGPRTLHRGRW